MRGTVLKKVVFLSLAAVLAFTASACSNQAADTDGKVVISVGHWPTEAEAQSYATMEAAKEKFETDNPNIVIEPDNYKYEVQTFTAKAAANQLATLYKTPITETQKIIRNGWAADITDALKNRQWYQALNPSLLDWMSDENGRICAIPVDMYALGLFVNQRLFREAGLVNEDGSLKVPETYQELAECAQTIKEKTGKAGFIMPTINNGGGWHFMNIAWSFGVEFMEQQDDGSWKATFDTQEMRDALQYVYDLRWQYNALLDDTVIDQGSMGKYLETEQAAMGFLSASEACSIPQGGMPKEDVYFASMPAGPKGRFAQTGGDVQYIAADATPEQIEAALDWMEFQGLGAVMSDDALKNQEEGIKGRLELGRIIPDRVPFPIWTDGNVSEKVNALYRKYTNINVANFENYFAFEGVTIKPEYSECTQELYATLDKCIQEVLTNQNADIDGLVKNANEEFQLNYLNKLS